MSRYNLSLIILLTLSMCASAVVSREVSATPQVHARLASVEGKKGALIHVTLRTQEGLERFIFTPRESTTTTTEETHLSGFARPRTFQRERLPAALTITNGRAWIFFTSRRTGRPAAGILSLSGGDTEILAKRVGISRVPQKRLECGTHAGEHADAKQPLTSSAKRRVNRSSDSKFRAGKANLFSPARVLEVATEADYEFFQIHGSDTNSYIRAVLNAVDVIYAADLGVKIKVVGQRVITSDPGRRGSIDSLDLLEEFRQGAFASNHPADVRHLFTGRSIDGLTIGIAYVAATCTAGGRYGVGLSRDVSAGLQPFLAAHEIAHNLSATHDTETNSIMNPEITEANNRFSSRALNSIYNFVSTTGSCIRSETLSSAKIALDATDPTQFLAQVSFKATGTSPCSVTLYGSSDARRYSPLVTRTASRALDSSTRVTTFRAEAPPLSSSQTFSFKAKVSCGSSRMVSAPAKLRYGLATSGAADSRGSSRWLELLRRNLR